jgi:hypothetical protein
MFKFDFNLDDDELGDGDVLGIPAQADASAIPEDVPELACVEITLAELVSFTHVFHSCVAAHASQDLARHPPTRDLVLSAGHHV